MKNRLFINGIASISAQAGNAVFSDAISEYHQNIIPAIAPNYKEFIPATSLRRMSVAVKMGITAAKIALKDAGVSMPGAIITGTGQGCQQDTEKFLGTLLEQNE
ncbi:MAG: 3-oxoacyl-ACP synthase, partial [Gillisia sp.]